MKRASPGRDSAAAGLNPNGRPALAGDGVSTASRLLDLNAAAQYLGVSYWTVRDLVNGGGLPTVKIPCPSARDGRSIRRILIDRQDLDALIERNKELES